MSAAVMTPNGVIPGALVLVIGAAYVALWAALYWAAWLLADAMGNLS